MRIPIVCIAAAACAPAADPADRGATAWSPTVGAAIQVIPGPGLPAEATPQDSNNNLDIAWLDGELFVAWRTAPSHFASTDTRLHIMRSADLQTWTHETSLHMETDLREPRFLAWAGELHFWFAVLGESATDFEPQGTMKMVRGTDGIWSEPDWWGSDTFIPWRIHTWQGRPHMTGYTGGGDVYDVGELPQIDVMFLASEDGVDWAGVDPDKPVVFSGGGSETAFSFLADGSLVAVIRNEAGDAEGFGSKICRAPATALADWTCAPDPRKYDSPLSFVQADPSGAERVWLIGRRHLSETGNYDLAADGVDVSGQSHAQRTLANQAAYWGVEKRCSLWEVDPSALTVQWVLDLPSSGDTCFASAYPLEDQPGVWEVWNYSSPLDTDPSWIEGQTGQTHIHRVHLDFR